jgi:hypothetical protein
LYPNPAGHGLTLNGRDLQRYSRIRVHDVTGKIVESIPYVFVQEALTIDLSEYRDGIYFLTLSGSDPHASTTMKFLVRNN